jgi:hypothetical protein
MYEVRRAHRTVPAQQFNLFVLHRSANVHTHKFSFNGAIQVTWLLHPISQEA